MTEPVIVGVLYPPQWNPEFAVHVARLEGLDPRIEVVAETYTESEESRAGRGVPPYDDVRQLAPTLTGAQRDAFARLECCVAIDLPFDVASVAPRLRWVQGVGAGVAQLESAGLADAGIVLTNASGANATAIAEFVMARVLGEYKRVRRLDEAQGGRTWEPVFGEEISGKTIGLIGFGSINQRVAGLARAFGLHVIALRRSAAASDLADEVVGPDDLGSLLARCDVVVGAVPESPATADLMDADAFAAMRPGSMFVNVGRGSLVDEDALAAALVEGHLRAAAIDVARVEPLPEQSPLWSAPNLYISAHCSTDPGRLFPNLHAIFEDNVARYLAGDPLRNLQ